MGTVEDSSQEKLDHMLREGTVSEDDYLSLSRALAAPPEPPRGARATGGGIGLRKIWGERQLGGVCAGLARYFGIDPLLVRVAVAILCLFAPATAALLYSGAYLLLPWDDVEAAKDSRNRTDALWLAVWGLTFLTLVPVALALFLGPLLASIYGNLGAQLPIVARYAITLMDGYGRGLDHGSIPLGVFPSLAVVALASLGCCAIHHDARRRAYRIIFYVAAFGWTLFLCVASCSGLIQFVTTVK